MAKVLLVTLLIAVAIGVWHRKRRREVEPEIVAEGEWLEDERAGLPSDDSSPNH